MCVGLSRPRVKAAPRSRETHPQITRKPGRCHPGRGSAWGSHKDLATAGVRDKHAARDFGSNGFNRCYSVSSPGSSFIVGNTYAAAAADPPPAPKALQAQSRGRQSNGWSPAHVHTRNSHHHDEDKHARPGRETWLKTHRKDYHCHQSSNPNHCGKRPQGKCLQSYQLTCKQPREKPWPLEARLRPLRPCLPAERGARADPASSELRLRTGSRRISKATASSLVNSTELPLLYKLCSSWQNR